MFEEAADKIINDEQSLRPLAEIIYDLVDGDKRLQIPELVEYMKDMVKNKA